MTTTTTATLGFRAKTAKAIAIALSDRDAPRFVRRWNVELYDRAMPETGQPHHTVMELPWPDAQIAVRRFEQAIENVAVERLRALIDELRSDSVRVTCVGIVGSPDRDLAKIGNPHIRAHAAEGILFRHAIEVAAKRCRLACRKFSDRGFEDFGQTAKQIKNVLDGIGRDAGRPWRADERAAATAAWIVLGASA